MLRFIAVEPVVQNIYDLVYDHQREKNCCGDEFDRTRHFEVIGSPPRKRYVLQSCRVCLFWRHVEIRVALLNSIRKVFQLISAPNSQLIASRGATPFDHIKSDTA